MSAGDAVSPELPPQLSQQWQGTRVCVAGMGVSGVAVARVLASLGAAVTVVDDRDSEEMQQRAAELRQLGVTACPGAEHCADDAATRGALAGAELVVTSPGWHPAAPLLVAARDAGIPIIGDVELAWRLRPGHQRDSPDATATAPASWLALTGTNGKTSTVRMLAAMLQAAGLRACAAGNVGTPLLEAVLSTPPYDVLAIELSSFQLHWATSPHPFAAAVLNVAPDHIEWHGSLEAYAADKGRIYAPGTIAVSNADDAASGALAAGSPHHVSFTLGAPATGQLGVADGALRDRAFAADAELAEVEDVSPPAPHNVANALAAAALARAYGVAPGAIRAGLRAFQPDPHRIATVATVAGVRYVDDSKATNPHAAGASLAAYDPVVWVAGGQLKGAAVDEVVAASLPRLRGAVLLGEDRSVIRAAFARHAPNLPIIEIDSTDTGAMHDVIRAASRLAQPGDTVLLAPAGASFDMFDSYSARGDAFAETVELLAREQL